MLSKYSKALSSATEFGDAHLCNVCNKYILCTMSTIIAYVNNVSIAQASGQLIVTLSMYLRVVNIKH